jgi:RNA polymerase sigma-70 factor (ECF subfamily)
MTRSSVRMATVPSGWTRERDLTLAIQRGEEGALAALYERFAPQIYRVCDRLLHNPDDVQDAVQETFLRAYRSIDNLNGRYHLRAWLARIAHNVCLDHIRAVNRRPYSRSLEGLTEVSGSLDHTSPELLCLQGFEAKDVREALSNLPPLYRRAILLREVEGLSYPEIATRLSVDQSRIRTLLYRARIRFRKTWTTRVSLVFVFGGFQRLVKRLKLSDGPSGNAGQIAVGGVDAVPTCLAMHQCGQYVAERVTTAATALIVSGATVAGVPALLPDHSPTPVPRPMTSHFLGQIEDLLQQDAVDAIAHADMTRQVAESTTSVREAPAQQAIDDAASETTDEVASDEPVPAESAPEELVPTEADEVEAGLDQPPVAAPPEEASTDPPPAAEPSPADPAPVEPTPEEAPLVEPAPIEPTPGEEAISEETEQVEPAPIEPTPGEEAQTAPDQVEPAPPEPAPVDTGTGGPLPGDTEPDEFSVEVND